MKHFEKTFQILDALDREEISTQRQLADHSGISLGQVNYILKSLLEKGLVKINNFRHSQNKIGYAYFLTPKGIEEKSRLAVRFVLRKLKEYEFLKGRLTERLIKIEKKGYKRVLFIGPLMVKKFIESIIEEKGIGLVLANHFEDTISVGSIKKDTFDIALLFDEKSNAEKRAKRDFDISEERVMSLL